MIDYCENVTCENNGVCQRLFMNFTCACVHDGFSGRYCEIVSTKSLEKQNKRVHSSGRITFDEIMRKSE